MSIRSLNGGKEEAETSGEAGWEFLDSERRRDIDSGELRPSGPASALRGGDLTLLRLRPLLGGGAHVVLGDVFSGGQSPQGVSGALGPAGRAHRPPVLRHRRGQPEDGRRARERRGGGGRGLKRAWGLTWARWSGRGRSGPADPSHRRRAGAGRRRAETTDRRGNLPRTRPSLRADPPAELR